MITDSYSKMISDAGMRSVMKNEELGLLMREKQRISSTSANSDFEREMDMYRSGSAPPTVEGSLNAVGGLFDGAADGVPEELRSDPAYISYYYANVNLNPRLPPPVMNKEDWRFAQRLKSGGGGSSAIGDRRKVNRVVGDEGHNGQSLFASQMGFGGKMEEGNGAQAGQWGADGLIGLPGLGLGTMQKSLVDIIQDDITQNASLSRNPSRPASRAAFDNNVESSESHFAHLHQSSGGKPQGMSTSAHTYASALAASLSRNTTPDPQLVARAPSPGLLPIGGERVSSVEKRSVNGASSYNINDSSDLVAALSGMAISKNNMFDGENGSRCRTQNEIDDHQSMYHSQGDQKHLKNQYLNKSDGQYHLHSASQQSNGFYPNVGKGGGLGVDLKSSLSVDAQLELHKSAAAPAGSYLKGPSTPLLNGAGGSPSHYQTVDSPNSPFSSFGLNGYGLNPGSPSMMGNQLGTGNMAPLFENSYLAPNLFSAAAAAGELQSLGRIGNYSGGAGLQLPLLDPLYYQYLRSTEYAAAAAQLAALNDSVLDREGMGNAAYMDLLALQKGYLGGLGTLLSPQKSQSGFPYLGKSGSLNHGYYGNSAYNLGLSYPGSPLAGPVLPNSPIGSGSPVRHGERSLRYPSGMRNLAGGVMGSWHPGIGGSLDESFPSTLLDEFKSNKTRSFELSEIAGHVVEFSADQYGSRFIQQKLETATTEEKDMVYNEIMPHAFSLMTDVFGNYVIQKFFEHGSAIQIRELADQLTGHVLTLSLQMYGCRVIQKALEVVDLDQQTKMVVELDGHIMRCVRDQNGNHVIQKCIECVPEDAIQFIISVFYDQVVTLSTHPYGCRVIQRVLEHCNDPKTLRIVMDEILKSVPMLAQDQYGNYVVQHVLEHGKPHERTCIIDQLIGQIVQMSQQKFASNVVEKCLTFGTPEERQNLVTEMLGTTDENEPLQVMMKDQFANYVVQKVLETCDDRQLEMILNRIKTHLNALKKYTYGKHIVARVEKLVAAGEKRIGAMAAYSAAAS